jgi:hypothetical protein
LKKHTCCHKCYDLVTMLDVRHVFFAKVI